MDNRYSISMEFTGKPKMQHVLRFCGNWISAHSSRVKANFARIEAVKQRNNQLMGV